MENNTIDNIDWNSKKIAIFDVDGTLYDQSALRKVMLKEMIKYYALRPWKAYQFIILLVFRKTRADKAGVCEEKLSEKQFEWCKEKTGFSTAHIKKVINQWIFDRPLAHIAKTKFDYVNKFIDLLKEKGYKVTIYSDYFSNKKLEAFEINADLIVNATDDNINALKPHPKAVDYICDYYKAEKKDIIFFGDRDSRDGMCAQNANVDYINITKITAPYKSLYNAVKGKA